ncbi:class I SAM-dependent methyltransferase [Parvibaculum sp.]|uniref:class I SAM-dependent methyltransferase n=1 Tax=Parvibaculum sp. TaxID=2024848 RepID=UPI001D73371D|nr:class I SAM-dependent methyltransferase [Parvibaculum sp.]MBX3489285.1 class I SAM-dependent methyltransferase [Parvibaculum sp.]
MPVRAEFEKYRPLLNRLTAASADIGAGDGQPVWEIYVPAHRPVSRRIVDRLTRQGIACPPLDPIATFQARFYNYCRNGLKADPGFLAAAGLNLKLPPQDIHMISRGSGVFLDINNADFLIEACEDSGFTMAPGLDILDFGGSTGRTVCNLAYGFPEVRWHCCDPSPVSIAWGRENHPEVNYFVSNQNPPLARDGDSLDGILAKSVWTHFSASASRRWLTELSRVVRPGGFLALTAHGPHDIARRIVYGNPSPDYSLLAKAPRMAGPGLLDRIFKRSEAPSARRGKIEYGFLDMLVAEVSRSGHFFSPYSTLEWQGDIRDAENADTSQWGLTFFTQQWFKAHLEPTPWRIAGYHIGRTGHRQDIYVLRNGEPPRDRDAARG